MGKFFAFPSWLLCSLMVVVFSVGVALLILWIVRRTVPVKDLKKNHEVAGFTLSIIGVLYSVILGFTVISVQARYNEMEQNIHTEAILLADLYEDAGFFSTEDRARIRENLTSYVNYVIHEEWSVSPNKSIQPKAQDLLNKIWKSYYEIDINSEKMKIWYAESISKLNNFLSARLARQFTSWDHLGSMMWTMLILGGALTVSFMFFFGLDNLSNHMLMTGVLVGYISFMLYLVYSLDHMFTGPTAIQPTPLQEVLLLFQ